MNNATMEPPTLTLSEMLVELTVLMPSVVTELLITESNVTHSTMPCVHPTVQPLLLLVVMESSTLEKNVMPEPTTESLLLDADLIVPFHTVVMESEILELFLEPDLQLPEFSMRLAIFLKEPPHATQQLVPILVVMAS